MNSTTLNRPQSLYAKTAIEAYRRLQAASSLSPITAWQHSVAMFTRSKSSQNKGCPRSTFLGLCEEGLVKGVLSRGYLRDSSSDNKKYAVKAVQMLKKDASLATDKGRLWELANEGQCANSNCQMDVVLALWIGKAIV